MTALAAIALGEDDQARADALGWDAMRLAGLLAATADRSGGRAALRDQPGRDAWSGRPSIAWTYGVANDVVARLARFFSGLHLPPGAPVGLCLPNGSEACLTIMALERAGLTPCLLPLSWTEDELAQALEVAGVQAVVTQGVVGKERPAEVFCRLAARTFSLRFLCSYGPSVPDGVIDLDRVILDAGDSLALALPERADEGPGAAGLITFSRHDGACAAVFRPCSSVVAAAVAFLVAAKVGPGDRILSLLAPDDHAGLTTGLIAALVSGATLECHGLFQSDALARALEDSAPTHLVAPGWMEDHLARAGLPDSIASVVLVHRLPVRFKARTALRGAVVDVLALDELAVIARRRDARGQFALSLDDDARSNPTARNLLRVRRDANGVVQVAGLATRTLDYERGIAKPGHDDLWRTSGYRADVFAGIVIGLC